MTEATPRIAIVGPGRVGTAVGVLAQRHGYPVVALGARRAAAGRRAAVQFSPRPEVCDICAATAQADLVLVTVSDDAIGAVAARLVAEQALKKDTCVVHTSGAHHSGILACVRDVGGHAASAHPMQTFSNVESAMENLKDCYWFCEGDGKAVGMMRALITALGGNFFEIAADHKVDYHISAVIACNYFAVLMDLAMVMAERAGIDRNTAWRAFAPMVKLTLANVEALGAREALSGPIRRGDLDTVARHLDALRGHEPVVQKVYRSLGLWAASLCGTEGYLDGETVERIALRLDSATNDQDRSA